MPQVTRSVQRSALQERIDERLAEEQGDHRAEREERPEWYGRLAAGARRRHQHHTDDGARDWFPAWSPDGAHILFGLARQSDHEVKFQVGDAGCHQFCGGSQNILF